MTTSDCRRLGRHELVRVQEQAAGTSLTCPSCGVTRTVADDRKITYRYPRGGTR